MHGQNHIKCVQSFGWKILSEESLWRNEIEMKGTKKYDGIENVGMGWWEMVKTDGLLFFWYWTFGFWYIFRQLTNSLVCFPSTTCSRNYPFYSSNVLVIVFVRTYRQTRTHTNTNTHEHKETHMSLREQFPTWKNVTFDILVFRVSSLSPAGITHSRIILSPWVLTCPSFLCST
jgi:hypothetical protein